MDISDFTFGIALIGFTLFILMGLIVCLAFFGSDSNDHAINESDLLEKYRR